MSLHGLLTLLLLPPPNLVLLALGGLVLARWRRRAGMALVTVAVLGLLSLSLPVTAEALLVGLEQPAPPLPPGTPPPGAIVILGGTVARGRDPAGAAITDLGALTLARLRTGAALARATGLPILVSGGPIGRDGPPLAALMAASLATDFGVKTRWIEAESRDTWQNALDSAAMLRPAGIGTVYLVTQPWHMPRARAAFAHAGLLTVAAPTLRDRAPSWRGGGIVPDVRAWRRSYYALHEWLGRAWYAL